MRVDELHAGLGELGPEEHRHEPADDEEHERRREILDADHLVIGVDPEIVLPGMRAVTGMILGESRPPRDPVEPVVEGADAEQKADRPENERADEDDDVPVVDRVPAGEPANASNEIEAGQEEHGETPGAANEPRPHQRAPSLRLRPTPLARLRRRALDDAH